eukprot:TRINITY_DN37373_c0_g1_i1.p1 TRINITY_DN37373_c0_g1~~TRINITY_DN37373_c0_g1_i1.p1  ORF type:complete len:402 (+),score=96.85 TRINITY_DN37373_c0_g1_i1:72-1208(+)
MVSEVVITTKAEAGDTAETELNFKMKLNVDAIPWFPKGGAVAESVSPSSASPAHSPTTKIDKSTLLNLNTMKTKPPAGIPEDILVTLPLSPATGRKLCKHFSKTGRCKKGESCMFLHEMDLDLRRKLQLEREEAAVAKAIELDAENKEKEAKGLGAKERTVYVIGFDSSTSEESFLALMFLCGTVSKFQLCGDIRQPTRYGFVEFTTSFGAQKALSLDGRKFGTKTIKISLAKENIKGGVTLLEEHQIPILTAAVVRRERQSLYKLNDIRKLYLPHVDIQSHIKSAKSSALLAKYENIGCDSFSFSGFVQPAQEDGATPPDTPIHPLKLSTAESMFTLLQLSLTTAPENSDEGDVLEASSYSDSAPPSAADPEEEPTS